MAPRPSDGDAAAEGHGPLAELVSLYRRLHAGPELSGLERRTADIVATELVGRGMTVQQGVGGHGVVGVLANGPGPVVWLRAELDALPVAEVSGVQEPSRSPGVMHACGHDLHLTALIGSVELLAQQRDRWSGTLIALAQPAEETLSGAVAMLADGVYERWPRPDVLLAQHLAPLPVGVVAHGTEALTVAAVQLRLTLSGRGGHAGRADSADDVIGAAFEARTQLMHAARRAGAVGVTCAVSAGAAANVVPTEATLLAGLRGPRLEVLLALVTQFAEDWTGPVQLLVEVLGSAPALSDSPAERHMIVEAHRRVFGDEAVWTQFRSMAADDIALLALPDAGPEQRVPLVYWMLGCVDVERWRRSGPTTRERMAAQPSNHCGDFVPAVLPTLRVAVLAMTTAARVHLGSTPSPVERHPREARHLAAARLSS